jgi:hypothetical protein
MPGHVFVVCTVIEGVQYDAAVVPTSTGFSVRSYWSAVLGVSERRDSQHLNAKHLMPVGWPGNGFGRVPSSAKPGPARPTWFIASYVSRDLTDRDRITVLMTRLRGVLTDISEAALPAGEGRAMPLVALNTLGVGGGSFGPVRGAVIDEMFRTCNEFVADNDLDLVICCSSESDYAAFQHKRKHHDEKAQKDGVPTPFDLLGPLQRTHCERLAGRARRGELALFLGAGVSMPAGLPSWWGLLASLGKKCGVSEDVLASLDSPLDQAELIDRSLRAKGKNLTAEVGAEFAKVTVPSLSHIQLAALGCREVITTNFDVLYEKAADAVTGHKQRSTTQGDGRVKVLPFEQRKPFQKWILKMHGDINHRDSLILTRSQFVGYSTEHGPVGSIVQSLMLTKHLLAVGTSLTDDNFLRLAYETTNYLQRSSKARSTNDETPDEELFGTVLALKSTPSRDALWKGTFAVLSASDEPDPDLTGASPGDADRLRADIANRRARNLSILLDYIAMHAAAENYLLDARYEALLGKPDAPSTAEIKAASLARDLRTHVERLESSKEPESGWFALLRQLDALGAARSEDE